MGQALSSGAWKLSTMVDLQQKFDDLQASQVHESQIEELSQKSQGAIAKLYKNCTHIADALKMESKLYADAFNKEFTKVPWRPRRGDLPDSFAYARRFIAYLISNDGMIETTEQPYVFYFLLSLKLIST